ncbi:MAG: acetyl-CoA C-acetyltransferase [Candidatus Thermoplasmatota archaeon]|jgi:acetyl-CoA C-acetyltransferase|nr:acetyl-CoA C-acetyltransferase [Candidatus Thermoplasmatota archaeon]MCL5791290.1 acetyl-CoA C-acetyltransferase [Candidatus Thermoplasmatota archaeon]
MSEKDVYIVDYRRTAFSRSRPTQPERDVFNSIRMDEALGKLIKNVVSKSSINTDDINDMITGCAIQADENWTYGGRHPVFLAGLPFNVPSMSLDRACSSSLNAVTIGAMEIMTGNSEVVLAGGMEHMTHVPLSNNPHVKPNMRLMVRPEYMKYQMGISYNMLATAEKLADLRGITREEMDRYSYESHKLAAKAQDDGYFKGEILPVEVEHEGRSIVVDSDQAVRRDATMEDMVKLKPAYKEDGVITAGNSSPLNAGASLVALMSEKKMNESGMKPLVKIRSFAWAGVDPTIMGEGPVPATKKALEKAKLKPDDIDIWEINEAFAVVVLNAMKAFDIPREKVNVHGGGISIGHPLGATGARIVGTLGRILKEKNKKYGVATLCVGGGQGYSVVVEAV